MFLSLTECERKVWNAIIMILLYYESVKLFAWLLKHLVDTYGTHCSL